jgi:hypothetical protein
MSYFKKIGRLSDEERAVVERLDALIEQKNIPMELIPECSDLDDLLEVLELANSYEETAQLNDEPSMVEQDEFIEEVELVEEVEPNEQDESSLEDEPELDETFQEPDSTIEVEKPTETKTSEFLLDDYDPFSTEIIERSYNTGTKVKDNETKINPLDQDDDLKLEESGSTPVDNINPRTKQRAAEQTADTILKGYARIAPLPFKWLAKVNEAKVEELEWSGQIDISIEVSDGMTFEDYMKQTNEQVDDIFEVDQDTLNEIREPLIEVLMEQQMELTPQQRLMMAVVSHLFQMLTVALKLRKQNNRILEYQKQITRIAKVA